jgi:methylmalonyl-CoA decarboxylase
MSLIRLHVDEQIATLQFDHDAKRNALGAELIDEIIAAFAECKRQHVRAIVLRAGSGTKVWSSGHDVEELPRVGIDPLPYSDPLEVLLRAVDALPAPVIAMVHGSVWGGACELIMACDIVIGDESCTFAITPTKIGVPYNIAGLQRFVSRLPLNVVKEMFFTANPITAQRAERIGIVNAIVPADQLEEYTYGMARTIAKRSAVAIAALREQLRILSDESVAISPSTFEYLHGIRRDIYFGHDYEEGIRAFLEKRAPNFSGEALEFDGRRTREH